jgi:hypothetical protein
LVLWPGHNRPNAHCVCGPAARVSARGQFSNKNLFLFYFEFISDSNFKNSYLDIQSSKNYEIF